MPSDACLAVVDSFAFDLIGKVVAWEGIPNTKVLPDDSPTDCSKRRFSRLGWDSIILAALARFAQGGCFTAGLFQGRLAFNVLRCR